MSDQGGYLGELDPRFPIELTHGIQIFGGLLGEWSDQKTVIGQAQAATAQLGRGEIRYVAPAPVRDPGIPAPFVPQTEPPALAHSPAGGVEWAWTEGDRFELENTLEVTGLAVPQTGGRGMDREMRRAGRWWRFGRDR
jgi:hypothetical protein